MINRLIRISTIVCAVLGSAVTGKSEGPNTNMQRDNNTLTDQSRVGLLQEKLQLETFPSKKLGILKELAAEKNSFAKQVLMDYYKTIPPSASTTNPHSDAFKVGVFEIVLPLLERDERKKFVQSALDDELINLRNAYSQGLANMYPMSLWKNIMSIVDSDDAVRDLKDRYTLILISLAV